MNNLTDKIDEQGAKLEKLVEILEEMEAKKARLRSEIASHQKD